jgi:2-isopropylmalate synthase
MAAVPEKGPRPLFIFQINIEGEKTMKSKMPFYKYKPFPEMILPGRTWPENAITHAPIWCSVDLRDGNQALVHPMNTEKKRDMFSLCAAMGFQEIEVGFPSASQTDFDFVRFLIEGEHIPEDVTIQVLTQAREQLIKKSFESLRDVKRAIVHLYNSTSTLQRRVVFGMSKGEIRELAIAGARLIREETERLTGSDIRYEYTPESFMATEPDFAVDICEAVMDVWEPTPERKVIINLPLTMEMATPNIYADQIEWFCRHIKNRDSIIISTHAHNDRGTAVAATELAVMAGAERVEGTLFGNGERTGNVDIITLALNHYTQGIDPGLDFSDINKIIDVYERCTGIPVHIRHPYAGELVYTAFSGSHQDAISKGMKALVKEKNQYWEVPYLPIDPADVGRTYESIIRINSQSGKGGVAYVMENEYGLQLPREMHPEFGKIIKAISDRTGQEVTSAAVRDVFEAEYLGKTIPYELKSCKLMNNNGDAKDHESDIMIKAVIVFRGKNKEIVGCGNGPIDAFCNALKEEFDLIFRLSAYHEHAIEKGSNAKAAAYIRIEDESGKSSWGAGIDPNIDIASFRALLSALNRSGIADSKNRVEENQPL